MRALRCRREVTIRKRSVEVKMFFLKQIRIGNEKRNMDINISVIRSTRKCLSSSTPANLEKPNQGFYFIPGVCFFL